MKLVEYEGLVEYERWIEKHEAYTSVCTCSCLCSNTHRILTVDVFHVGLKLHWKHDTSINFHCLQARLLWRWWSFRNCVLPLSNRREFFQMERMPKSQAGPQRVCTVRSAHYTTEEGPHHCSTAQTMCTNMGGREGDSHKHNRPSCPQVQPSQPGGNSLHTSLWSLC